MNLFKSGWLSKGPLLISMAQYSAVLKIVHWVSSLFNRGKNLFQGFCSRDDSGIFEYGFALGSIVMYFDVQRWENDDGIKIVIYTDPYHTVWTSIRLYPDCKVSESSMYNDWILKAPQVVLRMGNIYGPHTGQYGRIFGNTGSTEAELREF